MLAVACSLALAQDPSPESEIAPLSGFGASVCFTADCDGDGVADILVGAPLEQATPNSSVQGVVRLYSGRSGALLRVHRGEYGMGFCVVNIGDTNDDDVSDYAARGSDEVRIWSGATGEELLCTGPRFTGSQFEDYGRLSAAGDLDGDGRPDLLITEGDVIRGLSSVTGGTILLIAHPRPCEPDFDPVLGGRDLDQDGFLDILCGTRGPWDRTRPSRVDVFSGRTHRSIGVVEGDARRDELGSCLAFVHDLDGDGIDEWIAGSTDPPGPVPISNARVREGYALVISGSNRRVLFRLESPLMASATTFEGVRFAHRVADCGDLDGDGKHDVLVGYRSESMGPRPAICVFSGRNGSLLETIDLGADFDLGGGFVDGGLGYDLAAGEDLDGDSSPDAVISDLDDDFGWPMWGGEVHVVSLKERRILRTLHP